MRRQLLWAVLAVGYALVASRLAPLSWPAMLATVPPAAALCWVALRRPVVVAPVSRIGLRRVLPWLVVAATGLAWELFAVLQSPRHDYPTLSSLLSPLAGDSDGWYRFAGYLLWFALGSWLVRR